METETVLIPNEKAELYEAFINEMLWTVKIKCLDVRDFSTMYKLTTPNADELNSAINYAEKLGSE